MLQTGLQKELEELSRERDAYINFERGISRNQEDLKSRKGANVGSKRRKSSDNRSEGLGEFDLEGDEEEWDDLTRRRGELESEEERLIRMLEGKEKELAAAKEEEKRAKEEEKEVERQETEYVILFSWQEHQCSRQRKVWRADNDRYLLHHAELSTELDRQEKALSTARTKLLLSTSMLRHLESTNVYNDAFQIGHVPLQPEGRSQHTPSGSITVGTINGLRLGGRPVVEWDEINAAWGLVALCIDRIAVKVGCTFSTSVSIHRGLR